MKSEPAPGRLTPVIGTFVNVAAVIFGAAIGLASGRNLPDRIQSLARLWTTALAVAMGAWLFWIGLQGPVGHAIRQMGVALAALCVGSLVGHLLGIQKRLTSLIRWAAGSQSAAEGVRSSLAVQAIVFAANPLGILGATLEGVSGLWQPLVLKSILDALAALSFAAAGSRNVVLAAVPLAAFQGTLTLMAGGWGPRMLSAGQVASLQMTSGLLMLTMAPVLFGWRQVPLANYLPALVLAPAITALFH